MSKGKSDLGWDYYVGADDEAEAPAEEVNPLIIYTLMAFGFGSWLWFFSSDEANVTWDTCSTFFVVVAFLWFIWLLWRRMTVT